MNEAAALTLGSVIVSRHRPGRGGSAQDRRGAASGKFVGLYFPLTGGGAGGRDVFLTDGTAAPPDVDGRDCIVLLAPARFVAGMVAAEQVPARLVRSRSLHLLQLYLDGVLKLDRSQWCEHQGRLAADAIRGLLAAAFLTGASERDVTSRRRASLLDEVIAHIDAHLCDALTVEGLCGSLACSRSALYRVTAGSGGVAELILRRRLLAIRAVLQDPTDRRPIAAVARAHGFADTPQFNRRFKAMFGTPPGMVRQSASPSEPTIDTTLH